MCDPVTLAAVGSTIASAASSAGAFLTSAAGMATMGVASTAASLGVELETTKAQNSAISAQLAQGRQQVQEQEATQLQQRAIEAHKEQGRMMVAAGEAGLQLGSGSIEAMLLDSSMQQNLYDQNTRLNAEHQDQGLASEANRSFSMVQQPTVVGAGLRLISAGVGGFAAGKAATIQRKAASVVAANSVAPA